MYWVEFAERSNPSPRMDFGFWYLQDGLQVFMAGVLHRNFPPGIVRSFLDLPWPLR